MDSIHIYGGNFLKGETRIQGSKNAVLPVLAATLLVEGVSVIKNCPRIADVYHMQNLLQGLGCKVCWAGNTLSVDATSVSDHGMANESVTRMRSSIMLLGSMLGRLGEVCMSYPGGCVIGDRPIDIHLAALRAMGVEIVEEPFYFMAKAGRLNGVEYMLPSKSVGATENVILAAVLAKGTTVVGNVAREPEITALCDFLTAAGASISGAGTDKLCIVGVEKLQETVYEVPSDRIVAGTYLIAALGAGGSIFLEAAPADQLKAVLTAAECMGGSVTVNEAGIGIDVFRKGKAIPYIKTEVYDGFPTDLQSPLLSALSVAEGESVVEESIFENRFRVVHELQEMGADITTNKKRAYVKGVKTLYGCVVDAQELRGGAALAVAGILAMGRTVIRNRHFIERGYEDICRDLKNLGADINLG